MTSKGDMFVIKFHSKGLAERFSDDLAGVLDLLLQFPNIGSPV
jgi:hypothetical protein